jgi:hypothetical protein
MSSTGKSGNSGRFWPGATPLFSTNTVPRSSENFRMPPLGEVRLPDFPDFPVPSLEVLEFLDFWRVNSRALTSSKSDGQGTRTTLKAVGLSTKSTDSLTGQDARRLIGVGALAGRQLHAERKQYQRLASGVSKACPIRSAAPRVELQP